MTSITTIQDSVLTSQSKYMEWESKWREEKMMPFLKAAMKAKFDSIGPDQKEQVKKLNPELYKFITETLGG